MNLQETQELIETPEYKQSHFNTALSELSILSPGQVTIDNEVYPLTDRGQKSLCKLLEIPEKFSKELNQDDEELWKHMTSKLKELRNHQIRFSVGDEKGQKFIHAFNHAIDPWISNSNFLKMIEYQLQESKNLQLKTILAWRGGLKCQFNLTDRTGVLEGSPTKNDIFSMGLDLANSEILSFRTQGDFSLERMVCTNRATTHEKEFRWLAVHKGTSENLMLEVYRGMDMLLTKNISVEKFIRERVGKMLNTKASVAEVSAAYTIGQSCAQRLPDRMASFDEMIPLPLVLKKYGIESTKDKSDKWLSTATTPIGLYDLYNNITHVASNAQELDDEEKMKMQVKIGNEFLGKTPDLLDIAPTVDWSLN